MVAGAIATTTEFPLQLIGSVAIEDNFEKKIRR